MIGFQAVCHAYNHPSVPGDHVPTIKERGAAYERRWVADGHTLRRLLRAERLSEREAHLVEQFLARLRMIEIASLLSHAGLTIYEIARAMHLSGSTTPAKTHWVNQFAARLGETNSARDG